MPQPLFDKDFLKKLEYLELIARRLVFGRRAALHASTKKGASIEFKDFREYTPGDDPRTVDWSVYARLGSLVVKLFRHDEELDLWILLDSSASMNVGDPNKFDYARRIAAALAYVGMANMDSAGVSPFADSLQTGCERLRGRGRVFQLLDYLTALTPRGNTDLATAVHTLVSRVRKPALVVVLSDFYGLENARRALDRLRYFKHQVFVIQTVSPWELNPPIRGELRLHDAESGEYEDMTITDSMLRNYKRAFQQLSDDLRAYSMQFSIGYALAPTDRAFDEFLLAIFKQGVLLQ